MDNLTVFSSGLLSKWGFNDGAAPDAWLDWCESQGIDYGPADFPWAALIRTHLLPVIEQEVTVVEVETSHNPIRVDTVDGVDVTGVWFGRAPEPRLTPESVDVPMSEVLRMVRAAADQGTQGG